MTSAFAAGGQDEILHRMHHRISQESTEKEALKMDSAQLRRIAELHIRQLTNLSGAPWNPDLFNRLKSSIGTFDAEIKDRCVLSEADMKSLKVSGSGDYKDLQQKSYEVLRNSLHESQKRCQGYNDNMLRVAHANDELAQTLNTVKNTNKRLVDQLQVQSDEVNQLTQQRLLDEEKIEFMRKQFDTEQDNWKKEIGRKLDDLSSLQEEKYTGVKGQLTTQLQWCVNRLKKDAEDTTDVKKLQDGIKVDMKNMNEHVNNDLRKAIRVIGDQLHSIATKRTEEMSRLNDALHKVQIELVAKKELREKDSEHWEVKYNTLAQEKEDLAKQMDEVLMKLSMEIQGVDKQRQTEKEQFEDRRRQMHSEAEELERKKASLTGMIETARRHCVQLDATNTALEEDRNVLSEVEKTLRYEIRESDQALADAVSGNERLREQMEETRSQSQQQNERDQAACRDGYEQKIKDKKLSHEQDTSFMENQVRNLESSVAARYGDADEARHGCDKLQVECTNLQRDVAFWHSQHELAATDAKNLETEYRESKTTWEKERSAAEEHMNDLINKRCHLEAALKQQRGSFTEFQHSAKESVGNRKKYLDNLNHRTRDSEAELATLKEDLKASTNELANRKREEANAIARQLEAQHELEKAYQNATRLAEEERAGYENTLLQERRDAQQLYEQFNRVREEQATTFQKWTDAPNQKIQQLEREVAELQDRSKMELNTIQASLKSTVKQVESFEAEVVRLNELGEESHGACAREREVLREKKRMGMESKARFDDDKKAAKHAALEAGHKSMNVGKHIGEMQRASETGKKRAHMEMEQTRTQMSRLLGETERETNRLMTEYEAHIGTLDVKYKMEAERGKGKLDQFNRENDHLRALVGDTRYGVAGSPSGALPAGESFNNANNSDMHSHLNKMQARTDELRQEMKKLASGSPQ